MTVPAAAPGPDGAALELAGRGTTFVRRWEGPAGAPVLMLLHGLGASGGLNWAGVADVLREDFTLVAPDHRGHGRGIRTPRFRLADCADDAVAIADALGVDRFVAVGYSMGGPIAQLAWHRHPTRVRGMVLCATSRHFVRRRTRSIFGGLTPLLEIGARATPEIVRYRWRGRMLERVADPDVRKWVGDELAGHDPVTVSQAAGAVMRYTSHDWIGDVDVPTAVVVTTRDRLVPPSRQYGLASAIADARVYEVDADHVEAVGRPGPLATAIRDACNDVLARAG